MLLCISIQVDWLIWAACVVWQETLNNDIQEGHVPLHNVPFNTFTIDFQSNLPEREKKNAEKYFYQGHRVRSLGWFALSLNLENNKPAH